MDEKMLPDGDEAKDTELREIETITVLSDEDGLFRELDPNKEPSRTPSFAFPDLRLVYPESVVRALEAINDLQSR